jgi:protein-L-isoaspartate(D-aspartate) O-methyltransferase
VTTIDIDEDLAEQARRNLAVVDVRGVSVVCADGAAGWPDGAPYDRIILTVGAWDLAPAWVVQLSAGGRLLVPLSLRSVQRTVAFEQAGDHLTSVSVAPCGFMPLRGQMAKPESVRPLRAGSGLFVNFDGECRLDTAALYTALGYPAELLTTGIRVTPAELFDGLALWLALHEPHRRGRCRPRLGHRLGPPGAGICPARDQGCGALAAQAGSQPDHRSRPSLPPGFDGRGCRDWDERQ